MYYSMHMQEMTNPIFYEKTEKENWIHFSARNFGYKILFDLHACQNRKWIRPGSGSAWFVWHFCPNFYNICHSI